MGVLSLRKPLFVAQFIINPYWYMKKSSSDSLPEWFGARLQTVRSARKIKVNPLEALLQRCASFVKTFKWKVKRLSASARATAIAFVEDRFIRDVRRIVKRLEPRYSLLLPKPGRAIEYAQFIAG